MQIPSKYGIIEIKDEESFLFGSSNNVRTYPLEINFSEQEFQPTSIHSVFLNEKPVGIFGAGGGCSSIHKHSAILLENLLYLAVGNHLVCINVSPFSLKWATQVDDATCFGVYFETNHSAIISHGELEIARISPEGRILWHSSGADIFTEEFELLPEFIKVIDFNHRVYHINYLTGEHLI